MPRVHNFPNWNFKPSIWRKICNWLWCTHLLIQSDGFWHQDASVIVPDAFCYLFLLDHVLQQDSCNCPTVAKWWQLCCPQETFTFSAQMDLTIKSFTLFVAPTPPCPSVGANMAMATAVTTKWLKMQTVIHQNLMKNASYETNKNRLPCFFVSVLLFLKCSFHSTIILPFTELDALQEQSGSTCCHQKVQDH